MLSWIVFFSWVFIVISAHEGDLFSDDKSDELHEATNDTSFRIIQGQSIAIEKVPYQAAMEKLTQLWCGGVIIDKDLILTAAHCVISPKKSENEDPWWIQIAKNTTIFTRIRVGANYSRTGGQLHKIKSIISHEKYTGGTDYDIAMVRVVAPFKFSERVKPIPLAKKEPKEGEMAIVTGYGKTKPMKRSTKNHGVHLMAVTLPIINREKCKKIFKKKKLVISERMICAGYTDSRIEDACQGDSGGPLAVNNELVGTVSWGIGCGRKNFPGVYMSVPKFYNWIQETKKKIYKE